jgi:hypothetical protein
MLRARHSPILVIFCVGLIAEFILPWAVIWLSDMFFFDIPGWSLWLLFGAPPVLSLLAILIHWGLTDLVGAAASYIPSLARAIARLSRSPGRRRSSLPRS